MPYSRLVFSHSDVRHKYIMTGKFFDKNNLHNATWAIIIALLGFVGGLVWKNFSGPDRVIIERDESYHNSDTTITIVKIEGDTSALSLLNMYNLKSSISSTKQNSISNSASIVKPKFELPGIVEGYLQSSISSFATVEIPRSTYSKDEMVEITLKVLNNETIKKISPVFVDIVKQTGKNSVTFIWGKQFRISNLENTIRFSADLSKDTYEMTVGFYLMDEIQQKYPPLYLKKFELRVI